MKLRLSVLLSVVLAGMGLAAPKPPIQSTPNTTNISTGLPANNTVPTWDTANNRWTYQLPPGAGGGEANTMSNLGDPVGVGLYNSKLGVDLRLNNLNAGTGLGIASNANVVTISPAGNLADWVKITTNGMAPIVGGGTNLYGSLATKAEITAGGTNIYGMFATKADITSGGTNLYGALATKAEITAGGTNLYGSLAGKADITAGGTNLYGALAGKAPNTYAGVTNALGIFTGATTTYLRADGTMATPGGSGDMVADNVLTAGNPLVGNGTTHALATNALVLGGTNLVGAIAGKAEISAGGTNLYGSLAAKANIVDGGTNLYGALAGKAPNTYAGVTNALGNFTGSSTTFLRADGTMATPSGIGDVVADGSPWTSGYFMVAGTTDKHLYSTNVLTVTEADAGELVVTNTATAAQMSTVTNRMGYGIVTNDLSVSGALTGGGTNVWAAIAGKAEIVAGGTNLYGALATKVEITAGGTNIYGMFAAKANIVDGGTNLYGALAGKAPNTYAGVTNALGIFTGATTTFLRADGTMATPGGSGDMVADNTLTAGFPLVGNGTTHALATNSILVPYLVVSNTAVTKFGGTTNHLMRVLDVTQPPFNADATGAADSTAAIQSAIDVSGGLTYRPIISLPAGLYKFASPVVVDHTVIIQGASPAYSSTGTIITNAGTGASFEVQAEGVEISNIKFLGGAASNARYGISYFLATPGGAPYQRVSNCRFDNLRGGLLLAHAWSSKFSGLTFVSCGDAVTISNHCSNIEFTSCDFNTSTNGVRYVNDTGAGNGTGGSTFLECAFQNDKFGLIATNVQVASIKLFGCHYEGNDTNDVYLVDSPNLLIVGGAFSATGTTNIYLSNAHSPKIIGIEIADNSVPLYADSATTGLIYQGVYDSGGYGNAAVINSTDYIKLGDGAAWLGTTNVAGALAGKQAASAVLDHYAGTDTNAILAAIGGAPLASPTFTGTATIPTLSSVSASTGVLTVTNNIGVKFQAAITDAVNLTNGFRTNTVTGAITILHASNGISGQLLKSTVAFYAQGNQTLTIPSGAGVGWQTNTYSPVPPTLTNGYVTMMYLTSLGETDTAAKQTNVLVSFEYYKAP